MHESNPLFAVAVEIPGEWDESQPIAAPTFEGLKAKVEIIRRTHPDSQVNITPVYIALSPTEWVTKCGDLPLAQ